MRKLISLLLAVVMVMGLATVAFAATDAGEHTVEAKADIPTTITLAAGEAAIYNFPGRSEAAATLSGTNVKLSGDKPGAIWVIEDWGWGGELNEDNGYVVETDTNVDMAWGGTLTIKNTGTETATYTFEVMPAPGSMANPLPMSLGEWGMYAGTDPSLNWEKYFTYTNETDKAEILTIKNIEMNYNALNMDNVNFNIILTRDDNKEVSLWSDAGYADEVSIGLLPEQTVMVAVRAAELETVQGYIDVMFEAYAEEAPVGSEVVPVEIAAMGEIEVKAEDGMAAETYYAVNSMLAGSVVTATGVDYIIVGEDKIAAVDGVASAVLNGEGATIKLVVGDADEDGAAYKMVIEPAPIVIEAAGEFKAEVAAEAEVEYAVNSKLAGAILTVEGKDAYIIVGETKVAAVDGVASAVLEGEGAMIKVVIGNAGKEAATYAAKIAYAPTVIAAAGDYKVTVAPGAEVEYAVNSKLDGAVVTVKGEGAYLVVDGKKIEGKDGVVTATLEAKAATIKLVVGNAGKAAGEWTINVAVAGNPQTGDFGIIAAAVAITLSAIGGTAVVAKKKEN